MKALIVVNLAGFLTFLWNDIKTLENMGYQVEVAMNGQMADGTDAVEIVRLDEMRIPHYQIDFDTKNPLTKQNLTAFLQMKEVLKNQYAIIHCHTPIVGLITRLAAINSRKKGTKILYTTHGFSFTDRSSKKSWLIYFMVEKFASRFCDAIITINHEDYNNAKKMHCKNVYLISSVGIDNKRFEKVDIDRALYRNKLGVKPSDIMILAVGELSYRKNHQVIIRALGLLPNKEQYVIVVCGRAVVNSNVEQELTTLADVMGVRIRLVGHRLDIPEINKCADLAVIPSLREGLGMAGLEALASGIPVVGSDVQGIREYVLEGKTGFLCNPASPEEFAKAIHKITTMTEEEKADMAKECKATALKFDKSVSCEQMKRIYEAVC